jgi:hypothetical protein
LRHCAGSMAPVICFLDVWDNSFDLAWLQSTIEEAVTRHGRKSVLIDP